MPYKRTIRDNLAKYPKFWIIQKSLTFLEIILSSLFIRGFLTGIFMKYPKKL